MLIIRLFRFLRGYLCFHASEGFPERFLNLCNQAGVVVWDIVWRNDAMQGKTDRRGYALMQSCAAPAGIALRIERKVGLPFFLNTYRRRSGLLIGLALCIITLALLSGMVWTIEVNGNDRVPTEQILQVMEAQGLRQGVWRNRLNAREMSEAALPQLPGVGWISLNLRGSSAVIEVREELEQDAQQEERPQNIIATKAGQLAVAEIYSGSAEVRPGQAVLPGSLLAGGIISNADGSVRFVHATAYAVARTSILCRAELPRTVQCRRVGIAKTHLTLHILWFRIPLGPSPKGAAAALEDRFTWVTAGGKAMPLSLSRKTVLELTSQTRTRDDRQLQLAAAEAFFRAAFQTTRGAQVIAQEVTVSLAEEACSIELTGTAYENIGTVQPLE